MIEKEFTKLFKEMQKAEEDLMFSKGVEYTQGDFAKDRLANFYRPGKELDLDPKKICWIYLKKHLDSIVCYIKNNKTYSNETIEGRIHDARNYLALLLAIIKEQKKEGDLNV